MNPVIPTGSHLFKVEQAILVAVRDMERVEMFQRPSLIRKIHGGNPLQDLIQLLLTETLQDGEEAVRSAQDCFNLWYYVHWSAMVIYDT